MIYLSILFFVLFGVSLVKPLFKKDYNTDDLLVYPIGSIILSGLFFALSI